eukprot:Tamp_13958.p1 GENE.Tamp_13958~~Tamp_13958.p1  ORF type:complete len:279 (-),score=62.72 Tamp_13958:835-1560(-)
MADASEASPLPLSPSAGRAQVQQFSAGGGVPSSPKQPASPGGGAVPSSPGSERMHLAAAHGSPSAVAPQPGSDGAAAPWMLGAGKRSPPQLSLPADALGGPAQGLFSHAESPEVAARRACAEISELVAATRTQAVVLLQQRHATAGAGGGGDRERESHALQVHKLQADFAQAQREIEAKDKQIVSLLRRANGGSEVEKQLREQLAAEQKSSADLKVELQKQLGITAQLQAQLEKYNDMYSA